MRTRNAAHGFTLIELMIVIAIIGILAALAIPSYRWYVAKAQMSEAFNIAGRLKTPLVMFYANGGKCAALDANNGAASAPAAADLGGRFVASATFGDSCNIRVLLRNNGQISSLIAGKTLQLEAGYQTGGGFTPLPDAAANGVADQAIAWRCTSNASARYLPAVCEHKALGGG